MHSEFYSQLQFVPKNMVRTVLMFIFIVTNTWQWPKDTQGQVILDQILYWYLISQHNQFNEGTILHTINLSEVTAIEVRHVTAVISHYKVTLIWPDVISTSFMCGQNPLQMKRSKCETKRQRERDCPIRFICYKDQNR